MECSGRYLCQLGTFFSIFDFLSQKCQLFSYHHPPPPPTHTIEKEKKFSATKVTIILATCWTGNNHFFFANQGIDSVGAGARNGFTYGFTASNAQVSHQTWIVSQRNYSHTFFTYFSVSSHRRFTFIIQGLLK